jgi:ketosteroid isomerase-like protein
VSEAVAAWAAGDDGAFWRLLHPDVHYTVIGSTPVSGTYTSREDFFQRALFPMGALLAEGARPVEVDIVAEGPRVVLMWSGRGRMSNGAPYDNSYCWVLDVEDGRIRRIKAYLDTALVNDLFDQA